MLISADLLTRIGVRSPDVWAAPLSSAAAAAGISTPERISAFLAQTCVETGMFQALIESLDYPPETLLRQWPQHFNRGQAEQYGRTAAHPANQHLIAELAYGNRLGNRAAGSGDGWLFRGRGALGTTGRSNYIALAHVIGWADDVKDLPVWLETPEGACKSAAAFWEASDCNAFADRGDIVGLRRRINGGSIGLGVVRVLTRSIRAAMMVSSPAPALPPILVQPSGIRPLPVPPEAEPGITEHLNERALSDALNQRPNLI